MTTLKASSNRVSPDVNQVMKHLHYTAQAGVQPEDLTNPSFWGGTLHLAGATPGSLISIVDEMGSWFCTELPLSHHAAWKGRRSQVDSQTHTYHCLKLDASLNN